MLIIVFIGVFVFRFCLLNVMKMVKVNFYQQVVLSEPNSRWDNKRAGTYRHNQLRIVDNSALI